MKEAFFPINILNASEITTLLAKMNVKNNHYYIFNNNFYVKS